MLLVNGTMTPVAQLNFRPRSDFENRSNLFLINWFSRMLVVVKSSIMH